MGIATSKGVIRDFAGSYYVSEDDMAFGWPTSYLQLLPSKVEGGAQAWDYGKYSYFNVLLHCFRCSGGF
jgi:hypothetical protein